MMLARCVTVCHHKPRITKQRVKMAVNHAKLLCVDYEKSNECRLAWCYARELMDAYDYQFRPVEVVLKELPPDDWDFFSPLEERMYDV